MSDECRQVFLDTNTLCTLLKNARCEAGSSAPTSSSSLGNAARNHQLSSGPGIFKCHYAEVRKTDVRLRCTAVPSTDSYAVVRSVSRCRALLAGPFDFR